MSDAFREYRALLERIQRQPADRREDAAPRGDRLARRFLARWTFRLLLLGAALVLPFYLLVGGSLVLYRGLAVPTWPALLAGVLLTALILLLYARLLVGRVSSRRRVPRPVAKAVLAVVSAYCLYALVYLSSMHVKEEGLRRQYRSLHPLLRVATSTFILLDRDLVITDIDRQPWDYERMGLPRYERSLHFRQADGYAHAVDLRTIGRGEWRNFLMQAYFQLMGFKTMRHVGTADHLHVSLPMPRAR